MCMPPFVGRLHISGAGRAAMKRSAYVRGKRLLDSWIGKSWRYLLLPIKMLKTKRNEVHMAVVLLALIILPSGLLGYFSWRAIGHEQLRAQERLRESYRQFALLAAREIDETLKKVEKGWVAAVQGIIKPDMQRPAAEDFAELMGKEPLIAASFLLTAPGTVAYPPDLRIREESASPESQDVTSTSMTSLTSWSHRARNLNTAPTI